MLWTPPGAAVQASTAEHRAEIEAMADRFRSVIGEFNPQLRRIDPYLELIFWPPTAKKDVPGFVKGRYHVLWNPPVGVPVPIPITGPDGGFVEPDSGLFEWLARHDMWSSKARHERERMQKAAADSAARQRQREMEDRQEELKDRFNAAFRTSVSMADAGQWRQTARARRSK